MKNFFEPNTIAIIGASDEQGKVGYSLMKNLENFKGIVIPINIKHESIFGLKVYKNINDYPNSIDLAVIAIPAQFVSSVLEECGKKKIKDVIIISAGFSEIGNFEEEKKLVEIAKKYNIRFLGPNCFGVCNPYVNLDTTFALNTPEKGNIAFISQSGALWSYISDFSIGKFGFSGFVSLGNMANTGFEDFIEHFSKDKKTKSIVLYIEKLKDGKKFIDICRKCKKPIFAVKAGKSEKGSKAAISHTGSLATSFEIYKGAFKQSKIILLNSLEECFEKAAKHNFIFEKRRINAGKKIIIITNAGGAGALMADYCSEKGIDLIDWKEKNPLDVLGTAIASDYKRIFDEIKDKNFYDSVIIILTPQKMSEIEKTANAVIEFSKQTKKKIIACFLGGKSVLSVKEILEKNNVVCFNTLEEARQSL